MSIRGAAFANRAIWFWPPRKSDLKFGSFAISFMASVVRVVLSVERDLLHRGFVAGQRVHNVFYKVRVIGSLSAADPRAAPVIALGSLADCPVAEDSVADFRFAARINSGRKRVSEQREVDAPCGVEES